MKKSRLGIFFSFRGLRQSSSGPSVPFLYHHTSALMGIVLPSFRWKIAGADASEVDPPCHFVLVERSVIRC